jgi:hypothetical protein
MTNVPVGCFRVGVTVCIGLVMMLETEWLRTVFTYCHVFPSMIWLDDGNLCTLTIQVHNSIHMQGDTITSCTLVNPIYVVVK